MLRRTVLLSSALLTLPSICLAKKTKVPEKEKSAVAMIRFQSTFLSSDLFTREQLKETIDTMKEKLPDVKDRELKTETRKLIAKAQALLFSSYVSRTQMREMNEQAALVNSIADELLNKYRN
ncbi:hypothetical protein [Parasutterella muris]|uniref:hypothetical protein n=1 Tax=Parasutterella muris TaxID=2565572 RepID=UPI00203E4B64|nr:hypothetical protein [Parasutterella muris]